jgi:DNA mismatch repair protein MutS2
MDIPEGILEAARGLMGRDQLQAAEYLKQLKSAADEQQALIEALESERRATAEKLASLERDHAGRESARRLQFEAALLRALQDFRLESERMLGSLKERSAAERLKKAADAGAAELKRAADRIRREVEKQGVLGPAPESAAKPAVPAGPQAADAPIRAGDRVQIGSLGREGTVESAHGDAFTVTIGSLRYRASRKDLLRIGPAESSMRVQVAAAGMDVDSVVPDEINLIGTTADEARDRVDKFLDGAFLAGLESVRIIHGHGKGILRRAIAELLTGHPQVGRFALAPPEKGGGGVTIVELKK